MDDKKTAARAEVVREEREKNSIELMKEYQEAYERRKRIVLRILGWVPLAVALAFAIIAGLSIPSALSTEQEENQIQAKLYDEAVAHADKQQKALSEAHDELLTKVSSVNVARYDAERTFGSDLASRIVADEDVTSTLNDAGLPKDAQLRTFLDERDEQGIPELTGGGDLRRVSVRLIDVSATEYTYFLTADVFESGAPKDAMAKTSMSMTYTLDGEGTLLSAQAHWTDAPAKS